MFAIEDTLVSEDLMLVKFCCDLPRCFGACCVEGDAGAPLTEEEVKLIGENLDNLRYYMTSEGVDWVDHFGVSDLDPAGNLVTPLLEEKECAFSCTEGEVARCAIEKAWEEGNFPFRKPVSCHLYPVRIRKYHLAEAVNYHHWHVCHPALVKGRDEDIPLYVFLKDALIRKYGEAWYGELVRAIEEKKQKLP